MKFSFSIKEAEKIFNSSLSSVTINDQNIPKRKSIRSFNPSKSLSIYIRLFINYAQMISIIHNLQLKWPPYVTNYLKVTGNVGTVSSQLFSLDCLIDDFDLKINSIYLKALSTIIIYVSFLGVSFLYFATKQIFFQKKNQMTKFLILSIVLSVMIQPNSIKETSDIFNCHEIEKKSYLLEQMSVECYTNDHTDWVFYLLI